MAIELKPLNGLVGQEVLGLDLDRPLADADIELLCNAWLDAGILLFRGSGTSPEHQLTLSRCFGALEIHPIESLRLQGYPELIQLASTSGDQEPVYSYNGIPTIGCIPWHMDLIYTTTPNRGALLRMVEKPKTRGQTGWVDTAAAYDMLPDTIKEKIDGLEARYEFIADTRQMRFGRDEDIRRLSGDLREFPEFPGVAHPLVLTHPESGRKALCLSPVQLREMVDYDRTEGDALLDYLVSHLLEPRFTYVHEWAVNDMVIWDNWRALHKAFGHAPGTSRLVHRTTIAGGPQFGRLI